MNTEKIAKYKKSLDNANIPANVKTKIEAEIKRLEDLDAKQKEASEKKEEAPASAPAKKTRAKRTPKATPSRTSTPKSTTRKKPTRTVMAVAKEIRKEGESWKDAQARARKMMKSDATEVTKKVESELDKLNKLVKSKKELRGMSGKTNLLRDASRKALPAGRRVSKDGNVYYENRANRADRGTYGKYHLAEGGYLTDPTFGTFQNQVFADGGDVDAKNWIGYDKDHLMHKETGVIVLRGTNLKDIQPKDIKGIDMLSNQGYALGGGVDKPLKTYEILKNGTQQGEVQATSLAEAKRKVFATYGEHRDVYEAEDEEYARGGGIPNNYEGKSPEEVWNMWTEKQKQHFLVDHFNHFIVEEFKGKNLIDISRLEFKKLPLRVRLELDFHVNKGQYARGGGVRKVGGREYSLGRNWTNDHNHVNKGEEHEVSYKRKRSFDEGGDVKKQQLKKGDDVLIIGRRWFDKANGNTYHTAEVVVNDKVIGKSRMSYGYEEQYIQTGKEILLDHFELPKGMKESSPLWQLREYGVEFRYRVTDGLKRDLELGGTVVTDLAGHTGGGTGGLDAGMPLSGFSNTSYSGLVGETGAMSSGEMFENGGGVQQSFVIVDSFGNPAQHYAKGGGVRKVGNREYSYGRNWTNDHNHVNKGEEHEVSYKRKRSFADGGDVDGKEVIKLKVYAYSGNVIREGDFLINYNDSTITFPSGKTFKVVPDREYTIKLQKTQIKANRGIVGLADFIKDINTPDTPFKGLAMDLIDLGKDGKYEFGGDFQAGVYANGGGVNDDSPRIYVADLEAYNNGRLVGQWLDLSDYNDADELNDAIQELLNGWGKEEYAIHDAENLPSGMYSEYMGARDFEQLYEMMDLAKENDLPLAVVQEIVSQYDTDAIDNFYGRYDSAVDFAEQLVDDTGIQSFIDFERYLIISDTDKRLLAQEMADSYVDDIKYEDDGERLIGEADLDLEEYQEADDDTREEMLEKAREIVYDRYYEEWETGLDDPYYFLVEEQGMYDAESFANANFVQIDYDAIADALEYDYTFVSHDGEVYVFNIH